MTRFTSLLLLTASVAACASLDPRPDRSRYFTLPPAEAPATTAAPIASLGLGPITLPPYVDRPEIATRVGAAEVAYGPDARWAAPLAEMVPRALAEELRGRLPARDVLRWPWPLGNPPEVAVAVDLLRFEADAGGGATLEARWTVAVRGRPPAAGETRVREAGPAGDAAASVAALSRALGALAADLATAARAPAR